MQLHTEKVQLHKTQQRLPQENNESLTRLQSEIQYQQQNQINKEEKGQLQWPRQQLQNAFDNPEALTPKLSGSPATLITSSSSASAVNPG